MLNINNYYKWYFIPKIKFNIIKYTRNRETALITHNKKITLRMLKIHNVQHVDFHLKALNWFKNRWNMYYSLAEYRNGIPNQKFNLNKRDNSEWKKSHYKSMIGFDLLIDIDASDHSEIEHAKTSALNIGQRLMDYEIPFDIRFSGMGFHLVVPYSYFADRNYSFNVEDDNSIYAAYSMIAKSIHDEYSSMVDTNLNDPRRLCKLPYSLAIYENNIYMCCPLSYHELINFELDQFTPKNALKWLGA